MISYDFGAFDSVNPDVYKQNVRAFKFLCSKSVLVFDREGSIFQTSIQNENCMFQAHQTFECDGLGGLESLELLLEQKSWPRASEEASAKIKLVKRRAPPAAEELSD